MLRSATIFAILVICAGLSGCNSSTRHGDAELFRSTWLFNSGLCLTLPRVPLDTVGKTSFNVRDLPTAIYPQVIQIPAQTTHGRIDPSPWRDCRITVEITDLSGRCLHSITGTLGTVIHGEEGKLPHEHDHKLRYSTWYLQTPQHMEYLTSYDVSITVHTPSTRPDDWVRIVAMVPLSHTVRQFVFS